MKLRYTTQAQIDIDITVGWYEKQRKGLGIEFLNSIDTTTNRILENPASYPQKHKDYRSALIRKFPFTVFYIAEETEVVVHAVFDNRQDPEKRP